MRYKCLCCGKTSDDLGWREHEDGRDYFFCVKCGSEEPPIEFIEEANKLTKDQFDSLFDSGWRT